MSNHTSGTYTFVKDWYDLRDCVAGCVGGMMSIGLLNMKLHIKNVDSHRFRIRKVSGGPSSILSSDGQNVDVDVGELRYGERKEMLLELELDNGDIQKLGPGRSSQGRALNATDAFVQSMGLEAMNLGEADLVDGMMDRMIDEVPVVLNLIAQLKQDSSKIILLVEHKMDVVRSLADRIIVLHNGQLVADGKPAEVIASPIVQEAYLGITPGKNAA